MSNVINIAKNDRLGFLDGLHKEGVFYDVEVRDNMYPSVMSNGEVNYLSTGKKTLVNGNTSKPLSVMSDSYVVVQNKDVFTELDKRIAESGLDLTDAYTKVDVANGGANVAVQYIFPAHSVETDSGDKTSLMITAINSFNGTSSFCIYLGGFRSYCMNTQVFGTTIVAYRHQHCRGLSIKKAADIIRTGIDVFNMEGEVWKAMSKKSVSENKAWKALADYGNVDISEHGKYSDYVAWCATQKRMTKLENYMRIFNQYVKEMGNTEFALYNTFTHIATHGSSKKGDRKQSISGFEARNKVVKRVSRNWLTSYKEAA